MGVMLSGSQRRTRVEARRVAVGGGRKASYATEQAGYSTELGPLPRPFQTTEALADAALRSVIQPEADPTTEARQQRCAQYLGDSSVEACIDATLGMLEATTPLASYDPTDPKWQWETILND